MILSVETYAPWENLGLKAALKLIKETGYDGVDFSFYWQAADEFLSDDYIEKAYEIKKELKENGLICNQAHAPFDLKYGMELTDDTPEFLKVKRSIEACGIIGIDHIVVHGVSVPAPACSKLNMDYNYNYYRLLEPVCEKAGVKIAVENLMASFTYPDLMNEILKRLSSPWFIGLVDVGHAWLRAGIQPGEFIRQLDKGVLKGLHVHDNHGPMCHEDEHLAPFEGNIDFDDLMKALKETGYDGDFTMESIRYLKRYAEQGLLKEALIFEEKIARKLIDKLS